MDWQQLKFNRCPQCSSPIKAIGLLTTDYICTKCPFKISGDKYEAILKDRYRKVIMKGGRKRTNNLSELNNLGTKVQSEDFSDSPFADRQITQENNE